MITRPGRLALWTISVYKLPPSWNPNTAYETSFGTCVTVIFWLRFVPGHKCFFACSSFSRSEDAEGQVGTEDKYGQVKYRRDAQVSDTRLLFVMYNLAHTHEVLARQG